MKFINIFWSIKNQREDIKRFLNFLTLVNSAIRITTKEIPFSDLKTYLNQDTDHSVNILRYALVGNSNLKYNVLFQNWL